jgi:hypothetical protein
MPISPYGARCGRNRGQSPGTTVQIGTVCRPRSGFPHRHETAAVPAVLPTRSPLPAHATTRIERIVGSKAVRSGYASALTHLVLLIALALLVPRQERVSRPRPIDLQLGSTGTGDDDVEGQAIDMAATPLPPSEPPRAASDPVAELVVVPVASAAEPPITESIAEPLRSQDQPGPEAAVRAVPASLVRSARAPATAAADPGSVVAGRTTGRSAAVRGRGGSVFSEASVERGLAWLAAHQADDGSWRFDLSGCRCNGGCRDPGTVASTTASTGIALLPFLGAGHTHVEGDHRETVAKGLAYLAARLRPTPRGGDLGEGTMYGQGVATLALAEAYCMTRDDMLAGPAKDSIRFIAAAQDSYAGGWRYLPGQPGDITVTAWQVAALKSAAIGGLDVPGATIDGAGQFLDRVQSRGGTSYGYQGPRATPCTSAIGLLCRMYTGWQDTDAIDRGLADLARPGPDPTAIYQNFYLAQALLQRDHPAWPRWNAKNRDQIVAQQTRLGHEAGSWFFADPDTAPGGRLAHTALAVLTLEVYYRMLPIYGPRAVE